MQEVLGVPNSSRWVSGPIMAIYHGASSIRYLEGSGCFCGFNIGEVGCEKGSGRFLGDGPDRTGPGGDRRGLTAGPSARELDPPPNLPTLHPSDPISSRRLVQPLPPHRPTSRIKLTNLSGSEGPVRGKRTDHPGARKPRLHAAAGWTNVIKVIWGRVYGTRARQGPIRDGLLSSKTHGWGEIVDGHVIRDTAVESGPLSV